MKCKENKDCESFVKYESHRKDHKKKCSILIN